MRAAPPFQVSLRRFGVWRLGVLLFAALGLCSVAAWVHTREQAAGFQFWMILLASVVIVLALTMSLFRLPPVNLRWDGLSWHLGAPDVRAVDMVAGDVQAVIDLGPWMLLRFVAADSRPRRPTTRWLPVQRHGLEGQWHALRCSVYSPRPVHLDSAAGL
jgi:hypothetical protein